MVAFVNPVILLVNGDTVPFVVLASAIVGVAVVLQQTPCAVIAAPPFEVTAPPELAEIPVIFEIAAVVTVGTIGKVVKLTCRL